MPDIIAIAARRSILSAGMANEDFLLLVEENEGDAEIDIESLRAQGISTRVEVLGSTDQAELLLGAADADLPAAVILMLGLEPRVAYDFIRWIRRQPRFHTLVVIAIGLKGRMMEVQEAYAAGANAYFTKGSDFSALARTLRTIMDKPVEALARTDTHPAFRSSPHLYESRRIGESGGMANPAPVLLVDVNEGHAKQFAQSLNLLKLRNPLRRCASIDEAIEYLAGNGEFQDRARNPEPIILFLDIRLPDSHRLLAWLEAHPESKPAGIIALTNSHDMRPVIQAYHLGVHSFLKEPAKLEELRNALTAIPRTRLCGDATNGFWLEHSTSAS